MKLISRLTISIILFITTWSVAQTSLDQRTANATWRKNYNSVEEFINGYARVSDKDGSQGIIDSTGKVVIPLKYTSLSYPKGNLVVFSDKEEKYGILNLKGETLFPNKYTYLALNDNGKYIYYKENSDLMGVKDNQGENVFPNIYRMLRESSKPEHFILVNSSDKWGVSTPEKTILPLEYESLSTSSEGKYIIARKNEKAAILDFTGKIIVPFEYESISLSTDNQSFIGKKNKKSTLLNIDQKELLPYKYETLSFPLKNGFFIASDQNKYGIVDQKGTPLFLLEYDYLEDFQGFFIGYRGEKSDVVFQNGNRIQDAEGSSFELKNKKIIVSIRLKSGKTGVFDIEGNEIHPFEFDAFQYFNNETVIVKKDNKYAFCKFSNLAKVSYKYEFIDVLSLDDNYLPVAFRVKRLKKMGVIDENKHEIIPIIHDSIANFGYKRDLLLIQNAGKYGIVNKKNNVVIPCDYDFLKTVFENYFFASKDKNLVLLNSENKILFSNFYWGDAEESIYKVRDFFYIRNNSGLIGAIDLRGTIVLPFEYNYYFGKDHDFENDSIALMGKGKDSYSVNILQAKVVSETYNEIINFGKIKAAKKKGKFAFIDATKMKPITEFIYDNVTSGPLFPHSRYDMIFCKKDEFYSILDSNLAIVKEKMPFDTMYSDYGWISFIGKKGNNIDCFDNHLNPIVIPNGAEFESFTKLKYLIFKKVVGSKYDDQNPKEPIYKYGIATQNGKILHEAVYDRILKQPEGFSLEVNKKIGWLKDDTSPWFDTIYTSISLTYAKDYVILEKNNLFSLETKDRIIVLPLEYSDLRFDGNLFTLRKKVKLPISQVSGKMAWSSGVRTINSASQFLSIKKTDNSYQAFGSYYSIEKNKPFIEEPVQQNNEYVNNFPPKTITDPVYSVEISTPPRPNNSNEEMVEVEKYGIVSKDGKIIVPFIYDRLINSEIQENTIFVENNGLHGVFDKNGKMLIPIIYSTLQPAYNSANAYNQHYIAQKGEFFGLVDYNNKLIAPFEFKSIETPNYNRVFEILRDGIKGKLFSDGTEEFPVTELEKKYGLYDGMTHGYLDDQVVVVQRKWRLGFVNFKGEQLTPIKYTKIGHWYKNGSILVSINDKKGIVYNGKEVLPCEYDKIYDVSADAKFFIVEKNNQKGVVNAQNEFTPYNDIESIVKNIKADFTVKKEEKLDEDYAYKAIIAGLAIVSRNGKLGIFDNKKKIIIPFNYQYLSIETKDLFIFGENDKYGVINSQGKVIIPNLYDYIVYQDGNFLLFIQKNAGLFDVNGKEIIPINYKAIVMNREISKIILVSNDNKISFADEFGKITPTDLKDEVSIDDYVIKFDFTSGEVRFLKIPIPSTSMSLEGDRFVLDSNNDLYLKNVKTKSNSLIAKNYKDEIEELALSEGLIALKKRNENDFSGYGYVNNKGEWMIKPKYTEAYPFKNGFARVKKGSYYTFINNKGDEIAPSNFLEIGDFTPDGIAPVMIDKKIGLINTKGELVVPFLFYKKNYSRLIFDNGLLPVSLSSNFEDLAYINTKGEIIFKIYNR